MLMCEKCRWEFEVIGELELEQLQPARVYPTTYFGNDEQPHSPVTNVALRERRDRQTIYTGPR
jgi:hypothetical protein